jgi:hypothetical protein
VNQVARRLGKTFALVLPVVLVLSGTLAVTRVSWAGASDAQVLTASSTTRDQAAATAPQEALRARLLDELQQKDPGAALTDLQVAMAQQPSLARYCVSIARSLGRAAVAKYDGSVRRAQAWSRPVCDTAFATGVAAMG